MYINQSESNLVVHFTYFENDLPIVSSSDWLTWLSTLIPNWFKIIRLMLQNYAISELIVPFLTNQIVENAIDFKMKVIIEIIALLLNNKTLEFFIL